MSVHIILFKNLYNSNWAQKRIFLCVHWKLRQTFVNSKLICQFLVDFLQLMAKNVVSFERFHYHLASKEQTCKIANGKNMQIKLIWYFGAVKLYNHLSSISPFSHKIIDARLFLALMFDFFFIYFFSSIHRGLLTIYGNSSRKLSSIDRQLKSIFSFIVHNCSIAFSMKIHGISSQLGKFQFIFGYFLFSSFTVYSVVCIHYEDIYCVSNEYIPKGWWATNVLMCTFELGACN